MTKRKKLFLFCFFCSLFFHAGVLFLVHKHSLFFYSPVKDSFISKNFFSVEKLQKQKVLESVFKKITRAPKEQRQKNIHQPKQESTLVFKKDFVQEKISLGSPPKLETTFLKEKVKTEKILEKKSYLAPKVHSFSPKIHFEFIQPIEKMTSNFKTQAKREKVEKPETKVASFESFQPFSSSLHTEEKKLSSPEILVPSFSEKRSLQYYELVQSPKKELFKPNKIQQTAFKLPSLKTLKTLSIADDFHLEVTYFPDPKEGYIFAITLIPKQDIALPKIEQNFYFLIDRSNTIQRKRLKASRDAIYHALSYLHPKDQFNILAFDSTHEQLFTQQSYLTAGSKKDARYFLRDLRIASFFAFSNVFHPLYTVGFNKKAEEKIDNIIILSNGDSLVQDPVSTPYLLAKWNHFNQGKMCVFSLCMNNDKRIRDLEMLSILNKGWSMSSSTCGGIKRKIIKLMKTLEKPIAKDVTCSIISNHEHQSVTLFHLPCQLQNLYSQKPYILIGKASSLDDFFIFLQGKNNHKYLNIKKKVSFSKAKIEEASLVKQRNVQRAYELYYSYLFDLNPKHLKEAKALLENYQMYPAFQ